ncbi:MAG: hypothetical protein ACOYBL_06260 [Lachnospiraceae bacterium]
MKKIEQLAELKIQPGDFFQKILIKTVALGTSQKPLCPAASSHSVQYKVPELGFSGVIPSQSRLPSVHFLPCTQPG